MGVIGRAVLYLACDSDPTRLSGIRLRFTAPVVPGDTIRTEIWLDGKDIAFRASVPARDLVVAEGVATIDRFAEQPAVEFPRSVQPE